MRLGIGAKTFLAALALIAASVLVADVYVSRRADAWVTDMAERDLVVRARVAASAAAAGGASPADLAAWEALAAAQGATLGARVTFVRADGAVIGDSEVQASALSSLENHAGRPEVAAALAGRVGTDARLSATVKHRMLYVAVPAPPGGAVAVARVARPLAEVDRATSEVRGIVWTASAIALAIAAALSALVARRVSRAVGDVTAAARGMTRGDLAARTRVRGDDELAELGRALDTLADSLQGTLGALEGERDLLQSILEGMSEGVLVLGEHDRVVMMNAALREMLLLGSDPRGQIFLEVVRHAGLHELLLRARGRMERASADIETGGLKPRHLRVHAAALPGADGRLLAVFVDVTDLVRLESLRRDFVANVSHELRTPVASVRSAAETLEQGALRDPQAAARFLGIIARNTQRLQALIDDLLELSKLDAKELRLAREPVDVGRVAAIVAGTFRERAGAKGIGLGVRAASAPTIDSDARALEQIVANLVDNAVKYCPSGATVTIGVESTEDRVRVRVEDTGPGIDARHLPRLFERFYRVDAGRSRDVGGTGLGLAIVKHLAEALGGKVGVESEVGRGSTFWVDLPRRRPTSVTQTSPA